MSLPMPTGEPPLFFRLRKFMLSDSVTIRVVGSSNELFWTTFKNKKKQKQMIQTDGLTCTPRITA